MTASVLTEPDVEFRVVEHPHPVSSQSRSARESASVGGGGSHMCIRCRHREHAGTHPHDVALCNISRDAIPRDAVRAQLAATGDAAEAGDDGDGVEHAMTLAGLGSPRWSCYPNRGQVVRTVDCAGIPPPGGMHDSGTPARWNDGISRADVPGSCRRTGAQGKEEGGCLGDRLSEASALFASRGQPGCVIDSRSSFSSSCSRVSSPRST